MGIDAPMILIDKSTNKLRSIVSFDDDEVLSHATSRMRKPISRVQSNMTVRKGQIIIVNKNTMYE